MAHANVNRANRMHASGRAGGGRKGFASELHVRVTTCQVLEETILILHDDHKFLVANKQLEQSRDTAFAIEFNVVAQAPRETTRPYTRT